MSGSGLRRPWARATGIYCPDEPPSIFQSSGAAATLAGLGEQPAAAAPKRALMKVGCQSAPTNETHLKYFARYGVRDVCGYPTIEGDRVYAAVEELTRMRDLAEKNGVNIEGIAGPILTSSHIDREKHGVIMLAQGERDRDIEGMKTLSKNCAAAGIGSIKYNMSILGVVRLPGRAPGRGDSTFSAWRLADAREAATHAGGDREPPPGMASGWALTLDSVTVLGSHPCLPVCWGLRPTRRDECPWGGSSTGLRPARRFSVSGEDRRLKAGAGDWPFEILRRRKIRWTFLRKFCSVCMRACTVQAACDANHNW